MAQHTNTERDRIQELGQQAVGRGDFDGAYEIARPLAAAGDAEAEFTLALILAGGHGDPSPFKSRDEASVHWLRLSAYAKCEQALERLSASYAHGWSGAPKDLQLAKCFKTAIADKSLITKCRAVERAKGYVSE
jgi:TPR repeat protein